jgi:tRNA pseudouridine32 synthase / 23S rRNA pseudouridine746 synthase
LDFATSGILVICFTSKMANTIAKCFRERTSKKEYIAVCCGHVEKNEFVIDSPISEDKKFFFI